MLWYSLEAPWLGTSNEYPQDMFLLRNKKNIMWIPPLICSSVSGERIVAHGPPVSYFSIKNCLFVLRFYGPVNPMGSCRARSVYLATRLLGRLSPLSG